jgi:hypothetical protein
MSSENKTHEQLLAELRGVQEESALKAKITAAARDLVQFRRACCHRRILRRYTSANSEGIITT